ncbi:MAG TPA: flagellar assembly protein FliW [Alphaproteobacteria bacterium]|nr:flagellar assembly protein FliW [Alphaproteobacteria bacterium]
MPLTNALAPDRAAPAGPPPEIAEDLVEIDTRFGRFVYPRANTIEMPQGVLGFANFHQFALLTLPDQRFSQFRLLQCASEPALSFLVVPAALEGCGIDRADLDEALQALGFAAADTVLLLIVTIRKIEGRADITVNMRAPIVLDARRQIARQYVLSNNKYSIRQRL